VTRRRVIAAVIHNFLGAYTSRYSDHEGYWLFGKLVGRIHEVSIDLLRPTPTIADALLSFAMRLAASKFQDQAQKAGVAAFIREAVLVISESTTPRTGQVNGRVCAGHDVRLEVRAVSDLGRTFTGKKSMFAAPHDPRVEMRSMRGRALN
jgi:hypothetical protein